MTPEEWPIWTPAEGASLAPAPRAGRGRLSTVRQDFFLDPEFRLTEQERALLVAMLHRLVGDTATEIQVALPEEWLPANDDHDGLVQRLTRTQLLDIEGLMALLLRRADEERVAAAAQARSAANGRSLVQPLVSDANPEIAAAAMSVIIARGRRRDRFGRAIVELDDVPSDAAASLVFAVAAALRGRLPVHVGIADAEVQLCAAASALLEKHEPSRALDRLTGQLVALLDREGRLDEALIRTAIDQAELAFLAQAFARRAGIGMDSAFDELTSCDNSRVMRLLRLAGLSRQTAAHLLAVLGDLIGLAADAHSLEAFDSFTGERLSAARGWMQLSPIFQDSLRGLGHGDRSV